MPISVNKTSGGDEKYETPFQNAPKGKQSIGIAAGALNTSVAEIVDPDGVLKPGAIFVRTLAGTYQPLDTSTDTHSVGGADTNNDTLTVSGTDLTGKLSAGDLVEVSGSTANDGIYHVTDVVLSGGDTVVTVAEGVGDGTADGTIKLAEDFQLIGAVPYSLPLLPDNETSTLSGHGKMDVVVACEGTIQRAHIEDQLGRTLTFEEQAALHDSKNLQLVEPA